MLALSTYGEHVMERGHMSLTSRNVSFRNSGIGVIWLITVMAAGVRGRAKSTMSIRSFNFQRNQVIGRFVCTDF